MTYIIDRRLFQAGTLTVQQRVSEFLQAISDGADLNAFITVMAESAMVAAAESDRRFAAGLARPLEGCVVAVKDNISVRDIRLTCASRMLENFSPVYNATVIDRLTDAGAVIIGKTNMDEFAMGSSNETSAFGPVKNPHDTSRVPGGSSGGSAVAVAASMCHVALGSDTGGSVRQPASFCGVYGYKPTYGFVSRYGLVAFASSLDQIGVFAGCTADIGLIMQFISGKDPMDATSVECSAFRDFDPEAESAGQSRIIGRVSDTLLKDCSPEVVNVYNNFLQKAEAAGNRIVLIDLPASDLWIPTYFILAAAEASSNLSRFDGVRYGLRISDSQDTDMITATRTAGFGTEVKRRIMLGTFVLSSGYADQYYAKAQKARHHIADSYAKAFSSVDVLALPTTPDIAFPLGRQASPVQMWLIDLFTVSANIAGIPSISIPAGFASNGMPIGVQLQAAHGADALLLGEYAAIL